jgi:hypothetical protein
MNKPKDRTFREELQEMLTNLRSKIIDFEGKLANRESIDVNLYFDLVDELNRASKDMERMLKASRRVNK